MILVAATVGGNEFFYFPFDEYDASGPTVIGPQRNGTMYSFSPSQFVTGVKGNGVSLDGISQYVNFGNIR